MIKQLRSLFVLALLALVGQANAQVFTETFDQCESVGGNDGGWSKINPSGDIATDNTGWTFTYGYAAYQCAKFGTGSKQGSATTPSISLSGAGTLTFRAGAWKGDATTLNLSAEGATLDVTSVTLANEAFTDYTVNITEATGSVKITFSAAQASKNRFFLDDVVVTSTGSSSKQSAGLSFSATTATAVLGEAFTAPTLSNPNNLAVTYSSSNDTVATVDASGNVTINATGTTTIKATSEETDEYYAGSASYTLTVVSMVENIAAFKALGDGNSGILKLNDAQVLYVYNNDMYVRDATGAIDFYYSGLSYTAGQKLNGTVMGTYKSYYGTPELTNASDANVTTADGTAEPVELAIADLTSDYYCDFVKIEGTYNATDKTLDGVALYDKFDTGELDNLADGGRGAVTGILVPYQGNPEILVITAEEVASTKADAGLAFSVDTVTVDLGESFTAPTLTNPNNLTVTYASSDTDVATVDASTGEVTIVGAGTTKITASSEETDEYYAGSASYTLIVEKVYTSIKDFKTLDAKSTAKLKLTDAQVVYVNSYQTSSGNTNTELYVRDASGAIQFYNCGLDYTAGQILNGTLTATYNEYNGLPEITKVADADLTVTDGTATPRKVDSATSLTSDDYCDLVEVTGSYASADKTLDGVACYDKFKNGSLDNLTDGDYTMTAIVVCYKDAPELAPISVATGINEIKADVNTNDAIYNLAGQKVDESYKGIVIRNGKKYLNK
ncbi:MAG: Ig-like domain-containing protein [Prevotella sp.]|jgi:hypothetical protein